MKVIFRTLSISFFIISIILTSCTPSSKYLMQKNREDLKNSQEIAVLVLATVDPVKIGSEYRMKISGKKTGTVVKDIDRGSISISTENVEEPLIVEAWKGPIFINDMPYRGIIEVHNVLARLHVINRLSIEEYLLSVVASEIPSSWPPEALKAQAVAARTYALYHLNKKHSKTLYDLDATTSFQVYRGMSAEKPETTDAVIKTQNRIMMLNHQPVLSYFHSSCGGRTVDDKYVWSGEDMEYLQGIDCPYCSKSPDYKWEAYLPLTEIRSALKKKYYGIGIIESVTFRKQSGRVAQVVVTHQQGNLTVGGNDFRLLFPSKTVRSMYFASEKKGDGIQLRGHGWGHGVGMCQWGARGLAENGASYTDILNFYYKGITVSGINTGHIALLH